MIDIDDRRCYEFIYEQRILGAFETARCPCPLFLSIYY